jgi:hypothetical protein
VRRGEPDRSVARDIPLVAGELHGLRAWALEFRDGRARLVAHYAEVLWALDGEPTAAACEGGSWPRPHEAPGKWCSCGLYGLHPSEGSATRVLEEAGAECWPAELGGLIEAWGRVEVHETGFRAEFARPVALIMRHHEIGTDWGGLVERLADAHRAEVLVLENPQELVDHCRSLDLGLSARAVAELLPTAEQELLEAPATQKSDSPSPPANPEPTAPAPKRKRILRDIGSILGTGILAVVAMVIWLAVSGVIVVAALNLVFGWFETESHSPVAAARRHLEVVDQALLGAGGPRPVYVAVLGNDDSRRAALGVAPKLQLASGSRIGRLAASGPFEHPANVPPGGTAVAFDRVRAVPTGRLADPKLEVAAFRRAPELPVEITSVRLDGEACSLDARLVASKRLDRLSLIGIATHAGRIIGGSPLHLDEIPRGRSERHLQVPPGPLCHLRPARWSLYPVLALSHRRWR